MYTTIEGSEHYDHYEHFRLTLNFLISDPERRLASEQLLTQSRNELFRVAEYNAKVLFSIKGKLEDLLRGVMVRTERLAIHAERNGMLMQTAMPELSLHARDVGQYLWLQRIAKELQHGDMFEYWKSASYLLIFMERQDIKRKHEHRPDRTEASRRSGPLLIAASPNIVHLHRKHGPVGAIPIPCGRLYDGHSSISRF